MSLESKLIERDEIERKRRIYGWYLDIDGGVLARKHDQIDHDINVLLSSE